MSLGAIIGLSCRCLGVCSLLPLGGGTLGAFNRLGLSLAVSAWAIFCLELKFAHTYFLLEFLFGFFLILPAALLVELFASWGEVFDVTRGQTISSVYDPMSDHANSVFAIFLKWFAWAWLFANGLAAQMLENLILGAVDLTEFSQESFRLDEKVFSFIVTLCHSLEWLFVSILPIILLCLLIELFIAILSKFLEGVSLNTESFLLKSLVSFCVAGTMLCLITESEGFVDSVFDLSKAISGGG